MAVDLAVLCCIPLTEAEWLERFAHPECGDFVRRNTQELGEGDAQYTWRLFCKEAAFIQKKLDKLESLRVHVVRNAGHEDIRHAATCAADITVIAHWKHERVFADDIRAPHELRQLLESLACELPPPPQEGTQTDDQVMARFLDGLVLDGGSPLVAFPEGYGDGRLPTTVLRRERLNELAHLAAGNRVELWDGMVCAAEFSALFGEQLTGTAYMQICDSAILAETFGRRHPKAVCLYTRDLTQAGLNMTKVDAALPLMRARHWPLWRALIEVGDLIDSLAE